MKGKTFVLITTVLVLVLSIVVKTATAEFRPQSDEEKSSDTILLSPISPEGYIKTKTPDFTFTQDNTASKFKIKVINTLTQEVVFTYTVNQADCDLGVCTVHPPIALNNANLSGSQGQYLWKVRAYVEGIWQPYTSGLTFTVISNGFDSKFDLNYSKWKVIYGTWNIVSPGYLKTGGDNVDYVSIARDELTISGLVYEVKMKRKASFNGDSWIYIYGIPTPKDVYNDWNSYYSIDIFNNGDLSAWKHTYHNYVQLYVEHSVSAIVPYDWNVLTIWTDYPYVHMWVNQTYIGYFEDSLFSSGFVGIGMDKDISKKSPLLVDYAKAYYSTTPPYFIPITASGEPD